MSWEDFLSRRVEAAAEFNERSHRDDGVPAGDQLSPRLGHRGDVLYHRLHEDVERLVGRDTMLMPVSEVKSRLGTKREIELYQVAESAIAARELGYLRDADAWYWQWLSRFRQGPDGPTMGRPTASVLTCPRWSTSGGWSLPTC